MPCRRFFVAEDLVSRLGAIPLAVGHGTGSEIRQPLGYAIVGGLLLSPVSYALHDAGRLSRAGQASASAEPAYPSDRVCALGQTTNDRSRMNYRFRKATKSRPGCWLDTEKFEVNFRSGETSMKSFSNAPTSVPVQEFPFAPRGSIGKWSMNPCDS
jgi:hypothetical protein